MAQNNVYSLGRDGFIWWIGVVEDRNDPKALGRVRVRVFGHHTEDKTKIPTRDLPWAFCIQPANSASSGGIGSSPTGPIEGTWVVGFWRDPDYMQEPMIWGTLPGTKTASQAPQGQSPFDYSDEQVLPPPQINTVTVQGDGSRTSFSTPTDTTDAVVLVKINGEVQQPSNQAPSSPNNVETDTNDYGGGTTYTANDFSGSRFASNIANKINQIAPSVRSKFADGVKKFIADNSENGYDCNIAFSYRSIAQQRELYRNYQAGGPKAARPGSSWHNYASAIDLTIYVDGRYDDGSRGTSNYTGVARAAFAPYGLENEIDNDSGHFYPAAFGKSPPSKLKNGTVTLAEYAAEKGIA